MEEIISSPANPRIKNIIRLKHKAAERRKQNIIIVEGLREILMAKQNNFPIKTLLVCKDINKNKTILTGVPHLIYISKSVFEKIAIRENSDGLIALVEPKYYTLSTLQLSPCPLLLIIESVEKPGNLGAILRSADGAGADAVLVCSALCDIYHPQVIRSSLGCVFSKPVIITSATEIQQWLQKKAIQTYVTIVGATRNYTEVNYTLPCAIVLGNEAKGVSDSWISTANEKISIPMLGKADSLNVSVSAAIVLYEALRQRRSKKI